MYRARHLRHIRHVSVTPSSVVGSSSAGSTVTSPQNIQDAHELVDAKVLETARLQALGVPPTILSVDSPASVPLYIRRGSLLSIYGIGADSHVRNSLDIVNPIKHFLYGNYVSAYQKLVATSPFSVLVSSTARRILPLTSSNKSFVSLNLDGTTDWAILDNEALHVYTGNSLNVSLHRLPYTVTRQLAKAKKLSFKTSTGLNKWNKFGFTLLSGRGQAGLVGKGTIYNVNLQENEEILVNKNNLLGISVNGPYDLGNCVVKYDAPASPQEQQALTPARVETPSPTGSVSDQIKYWVALSSQWVSSLKSALARLQPHHFLVGTQQFVRVIGPRNLLLQANLTRQYDFGTSGSGTTEVAEPKSPDHKDPQDYLNYVTIGSSGKARFESTPNFSQSVKAIEKVKA